MLDDAIAMTLVVFLVVLRPIEVHWWRGGHLSDQALAALFALRVPLIALLFAWAAGFDAVALLAVMVPAVVLGLLLYRLSLRNAQSRRAREVLHTA